MSNITLNTNNVSVNWLQEHLNAEQLIVLNATIPKVVGGKSTLSEVQIPRTQFFDIKKEFSDLKGRFPNTIPTEFKFEEAAQRLGVNKDSIIVVYDELGIYSSPRAWWLFKTFGFNNNVVVLNGGLPEWLSKGFSTELKQEHKKPKGNFQATYNSNFITFIEDLDKISTNKNFKIIDARSSNRFKGIKPEPREGLRSGTIPSSINLPYKDVLVNNSLKQKIELETLFKDVATKEQQLVFSCGSGITACILALAADACDYKQVSIYDGSWTEYGTLTTSIMETPNHWSKEELVAYILLYAANSDYQESNTERNVIISKVDMQTFQKIHDEFDADNDYQSIQKIMASVEAHHYSQEDLSQLFADLKTMFFSDGDYDVLEQNLMLFLKKILQK